MRNRDEQNEPHIRNRAFGMKKRLQRKRENDRSPHADAITADSLAPGKDRQCDQRRCDRRWKTRSKIVFTKNFIARDLRPVSEGRFIKAKLIIKIGHDVIAALDHFARSFGKTRLVAVDQRQAPGTDNVKRQYDKK